MQLNIATVVCEELFLVQVVQKVIFVLTASKKKLSIRARSTYKLPQSQHRIYQVRKNFRAIVHSATSQERSRVER